MKNKYLLNVNNLKVHFKSKSGLVKAVDNISFNINAGEIVSVVGESGSGKSISALSITKIAPRSAIYVDGSIYFKNLDLFKLNEKNLNAIRGKEIAYIFQEPMVSFNPVFTIGKQIQEAVELHNKNLDSLNKVDDLLEKVHLPKRLKKSYPHEMSGGQLQRCMIAMALACSPDLLIADEPTTALDVTIQKEILILLKELKEKDNLSILLITHNFGVVSEISDRVYVMNNGCIIESGLTSKILNDPTANYTKELIKAVPRLK